MSDANGPEIRQIVQRVIHRAMGLAAQTAASATSATQNEAAPGSMPALREVIAIGADHGGFELKEILKADLPGLGFDVIDVGAHSKDAVDYPDIAHAVAGLLYAGKVKRGIIIDGAGIGSCIVANKVAGVRAGLAYDYSSAVNGREHNDTNVLTLGAGLIGVNLARQILKTWLTTPFGGGRHAQRVEKIAAIEKQYLK
jgi:ribose 5-phosphate isomerase B